MSDGAHGHLGLQAQGDGFALVEGKPAWPWRPVVVAPVAKLGARKNDVQVRRSRTADLFGDFPKGAALGAQSWSSQEITEKAPCGGIGTKMVYERN